MRVRHPAARVSHDGGAEAPLGPGGIAPGRCHQTPQHERPARQGLLAKDVQGTGFGSIQIAQSLRAVAFELQPLGILPLPV
jgi:hypothetical protein